MLISVVINTYNRAGSLRNALRSLQFQTYRDFEVIVVNGPSTDDTERVLSEFSEVIRVGNCPETNLSKSRNIGIALSSGEVVAFIDDDAIAEPQWLAAIACGYDSAKIGGVGGIVYDYTGYTLQYNRLCCDRLGEPHADLSAPFSAQNTRDADPFFHLLGANSSFRRECLVEIGGFDEEFDYYLDETEVCMQIIDRGYVLRSVDQAAVHHKFLASHLRTEGKFLHHPYSAVKNRAYFGLRNRSARQPFQKVMELSRAFAGRLQADGRLAANDGRLSQQDLPAYEKEIHEGLIAGIDQGLHGARRSADLPPPCPDRFLPFATVMPADPRLTICFVSREFPPCGGIGRFTWDLARGIAVRGHEVHLITASDIHNRVDREEDVWVHRIQPEETGAWKAAAARLPLRVVSWAEAVHREVGRIAETRNIDLVSAPVWDCEGLFCHLDDSLRTVLTLHTTLYTLSETDPAWAALRDLPARLEMERRIVSEAPCMTAPSHAILEKVQKNYQFRADPERAVVVPHGTPDRAGTYKSQRNDDRVRVLFVGRLERRKGVDTLMKAAMRLAPRYPRAEFIFVGDDTIAGDNGKTYRAWFEEQFGRQLGRERVVFKGKVSEDELYRNYADCDVFCAPSRFESFGLILIEAMMFAKPVIACSVGGMSEIVEHGGNGFLAPVDDVDALTKYLAELIASAEMRQRFGRRSRALFESNFTVERMVDKTLQTYAHFVRTWVPAGST
jgi:glycosyltransferase involved in cell wall biosynthesis